MKYSKEWTDRETNASISTGVKMKYINMKWKLNKSMLFKFAKTCILGQNVCTKHYSEYIMFNNQPMFGHKCFLF